MRAGWYERAGPAEQVIKVGDIPAVEPGYGEVLVRLHASGLNPSDYKKRGNQSVPLEFPRIVPHSDGAGIIAEVGEGVEAFGSGDRVWTFNAQWGRSKQSLARVVQLASMARVPQMSPGHSLEYAA